MSFDELDKKILESTEHNQLAFEGKAWDKMEVLLDRHLPVEKKRRRLFLWLLPLFLAGPIIFFTLPKKSKNEITGQKNKTVQSESATATNKSADGSNKTVPSKQASPGIIRQPFISADKIEPDLPKPFYTIDDINYKRERTIQYRELKNSNDPRQSSGDKTNKQQIDPAENKLSDQNNKITIPAMKDTDHNNKTLPGDTLLTHKKADSIKKEPESIADTATAVRNIKQEKAKGNKFSLNLSLGPDISSVGIDKPGKWRAQYGIGISYALSERLSIRTGFYAGSKKYTADSADYKSSYTIPRLQKVVADCFVYEIPVNLVYNFLPAKKHDWFVSAGLSSYLMKKEIYDYQYKNPWGQMQYYRHTYKNENAHIFSILHISGGYQYHFTDRLSFMAEPYVKIPVSGIGEGNVKLNSGGVLFTIGFKPFLNKR